MKFTGAIILLISVVTAHGEMMPRSARPSSERFFVEKTVAERVKAIEEAYKAKSAKDNQRHLESSIEAISNKVRSISPRSAKAPISEEILKIEPVKSIALDSIDVSHTAITSDGNSSIVISTEYAKTSTAFVASVHDVNSGALLLEKSWNPELFSKPRIVQFGKTFIEVRNLKSQDIALIEPTTGLIYMLLYSHANESEYVYADSGKFYAYKTGNKIVLNNIVSPDTLVIPVGRGADTTFEFRGLDENLHVTDKNKQGLVRNRVFDSAATLLSESINEPD